MQFESATRGNVAMQIWLGKQYLGQSDQRTELQLRPENADPKQLVILYQGMHPDEQLEFLEETMRAAGIQRGELIEQYEAAIDIPPSRRIAPKARDGGPT